MQKNGTKLHNILILGGSSDIGSELINFLPKKSNLFLHSNKKKFLNLVLFLNLILLKILFVILIWIPLISKRN